MCIGFKAKALEADPARNNGVATSYDTIVSDTLPAGLTYMNASPTPDLVLGNYIEWNAGDLASFLIEITAGVLRQRDPRTSKPFVEVVLDAAGQKGTGKWSAQVALELGVSAPAIAEAVFARAISAIKEERVRASSVLAGPAKRDAAPADIVDMVRDALYCGKISAYAQGFALLAAASKKYEWGLKFGEIARIWRGGCIIRARFLQHITDAFTRDAALANLMLDAHFASEIARRQGAWREVAALAALRGVPAPALATSLAYYDGYRSATLSANLIQAQRDFFGAHTYERTDEPRGRFFHVAARDEWVEVLLRRTDWFKVRSQKGAEGWVQRAQLEATNLEQKKEAEAVAFTLRELPPA